MEPIIIGLILKQHNYLIKFFNFIFDGLEVNLSTFHGQCFGIPERVQDSTDVHSTVFGLNSVIFSKFLHISAKINLIP